MNNKHDNRSFFYFLNSRFYLVFLFSTFYFLFSAHVAHAAQVYLFPQTQSVTVGDTTIAELRLNTEGENINAFDISVLYPKNMLAIKQIIDGGSLADIWVKRGAYSSEGGTLLFQGGRTDGFTGEGFIAKIIFEAKKEGPATITFTPTSQVLLSDGRGTGALTVFSPARYEIGTESRKTITLSSPTHPEESLWYAGKSIIIEWMPRENAAYSYILSRDSIQNPDDTPDGADPRAEYRVTDDGIYYFSIIESTDGVSWSSPTRRVLLHDSTKPEPFAIFVARDENVFDGRYFATFGTQDAVSGISHYEIKELRIEDIGLRSKKWEKVESPYPLGDQTLRSIIKVRAIDAAGNERIAFFIPRVVYITITGGIIFILLLGVLVIIIKRFYRRM